MASTRSMLALDKVPEYTMSVPGGVIILQYRKTPTTGGEETNGTLKYKKSRVKYSDDVCRRLCLILLDIERMEIPERRGSLYSFGFEEAERRKLNAERVGDLDADLRGIIRLANDFYKLLTIIENAKNLAHYNLDITQKLQELEQEAGKDSFAPIRQNENEV